MFIHGPLKLWTDWYSEHIPNYVLELDLKPRILTLIFLIQGVKVGVIGYITKNLGVYDSGNIANMTFYDEVESVNTAAKKLKEQGVNIIIAAGHAGKSSLHKCMLLVNVVCPPL